MNHKVGLFKTSVGYTSGITIPVESIAATDKNRRDLRCSGGV